MINLIKNLLVVLLTSSSVLAGTIDPLTQDSKYIEYGSKFDFVVSIHGITKKGDIFSASAVVIDKRWILTAAHVVDNVETCGIHYNNSTIVLVDEVITHQDYGKNFYSGDISLCRLKSNLDLEFYPQLYDATDELGKTCSIVGHGGTGTFLTGIVSYDGKKRGGSNEVESIYNDTMIVCSASRSIADGRTELEFIIGPGDSGGGLFIDGKLAGINSCVFAEKRSPKSQYGDEAGHTRISKYIEWIRNNITK